MKHSESPARPNLRKRLIFVVGGILVLFALVIGFNVFKGIMIGKYMASMGNEPQTVSTMKVEYLTWQPKLEAYGNVRAVHGADLAFDVSGLVDKVAVKSGVDVTQGQVLIELVAAQDRATLDALRATAHLAELTATRARQQLAVKAISQAAYDEAVASLKAAKGQADAQAALVAKKTLRAPFAGRIGIITANPGQYINSGDTVVTLQQLDPVFVDFHLPQVSLENLHVGNQVEVTAQSFGGKVFAGEVTAVDPRIDVTTRNIGVEARLANPEHLLIPGMFTHVAVANGKPRQYLTVPVTSITYAPYGDTVFVVHEGQPPKLDADGKPLPAPTKAKPKGKHEGGSDVDRYVEERLITAGPRRGSQVAILSGIKEGEVVVTSGQLKLRNGTPVLINNKVQPSFDANPNPQEQ